MPASGVHTFTDAEECAKAFDEGGIELVVTSPGRFWARLTRLNLTHLRLLTLRESLPRVAYVTLSSEWVHVAFPSRPRPPIVWGGAALRRGDIFFHSRGERLHQRTIGPADWSLLSLEPDHLAAMGQTLMASDLAPPQAGRRLRPSRLAIAYLLRLCAAAARLVERQPGLMRKPEVVRAIEHELFEALIACLARECERDEFGDRRREMQVMAQFEHILAAAPAGVMSMRALCAAIEVSERTLRSLPRMPWDRARPLHAAAASEAGPPRLAHCRFNRRERSGRGSPIWVFRAWPLCRRLPSRFRGGATRPRAARRSSRHVSGDFFQIRIARG